MNNLQVPRNVAVGGVIAGSMALVIGLLFFAMLSDRIGRRPVYIFGALFSAIFAFPFFLLAQTRDTHSDRPGLCRGNGHRERRDVRAPGGLFAELFGPRLRYSGFAFARELGSIIAGGPAPLIAGLLVAWMAGQPWGVCLYVIALSLITAFAVWCGPETYRNDIHAEDALDRRRAGRKRPY